MIALGDRVTMINDQARRSFTSNDQVALLDHLRESTDTTSERTSIADLPSGLTARLNYRPSFAADQLAGVVVQIQPLAGPPSTAGARRSPRARLALSKAVGSSDLWQRTLQTVAGAARTGEWAALIGEAGVGKSSAARAVVEHLSPQRRLRTIGWFPDGLGSVVDELREALDAGHDVLVPHVNLLPTPVLREVSELLLEVHDGDLRDKPWVAVTISRTDDAADPQLPEEILPFFSRTVTVPPLRLHLDDLPELVAALLDGLGCPQLRLSGDALAQFARLSWPGNVLQLKKVLMQVARDRRSGTVTMADLPSECRSVTHRRLSPLEALERDAIVRALAAHDSKSAAATALGMSRATIYRKIRVYGIT